MSTDSLERMFAAGSVDEKPATNTNYHRLYHHNLCPFSARARYTLSAKGIQFQECFVDLHEKAKWHVAVNGGAAPIIETPQGVLIPDSGVISQYALESNPSGGIQLIPSDPMQAAKMRLKIEAFNKLLPGFFPVVLSRGQDAEKVRKYKKETLPAFEAMCTEANGKWLFGTDELTQLDIHCAPIWEIIFLWVDPVYTDVEEILQIRTTAPNWCAYMDRFRSHPAI